MNATLKVSSIRLPHDAARKVAVHMAQSELSGEITTNLSVCGGEVERGLSITLFGVTSLQVRVLFRWLRERYGFTCAWLEADEGEAGSYAGCILKWSLWTGEAQTEVGVRQTSQTWAGEPSPGEAVWAALDREAGRVPPVVYPQEQPRR